MRATLRRIAIGSAGTALLLALLLVLDRVTLTQLGPRQTISGLVLLGLVVGLVAFNLRKKLPFLRVGDANVWMQIHIYAGWLAIGVFFLHAGSGLPTGVLEGLLFGLFLAAAASGVLGLALSRLLPRRLTARGEAILFERIPALRVGLRQKAEQLLLDCARETQAAAIGDFYTSRLADFFAGPRHLAFHLLDSDRPIRRLLGDLEALRRFASEAESEIVAQLAECVRAKDDLDYQFAQQMALRGWLFAHVPLSYLLLLAGAVHGLLGLSFGGAR